MADYNHINEKAHESCKCPFFDSKTKTFCGEVVTFRINSKANATKCKNGHTVLRSNVEKQSNGDRK